MVKLLEERKAEHQEHWPEGDEKADDEIGPASSLDLASHISHDLRESFMEGYKVRKKN